ncbi:hypothetical protein EHP00_1864 [Ecytonucleospora hepatopenaei]|uniref:Uncharacterized protein n=1 Tax=Ecytonucleospora hepatopenaei TaxID=646526 RepID=A0A1W0E372_9MICR|nr:hypothetical protein EHP00_1864 [Ecytonucleospora hepatopenaei]
MKIKPSKHKKTHSFEERFRNLEKEIENMCFSHMNDLPFLVNEENNREAFINNSQYKDQVFTYFDKIYKRLREQIQDGSDNVRILLEQMECSFNENFLNDLKEEETYKKCAGTYFNCMKLGKIFHLYFYICNYHTVIYDFYGKKLFKVIYKTFINFDQKEVISFLKEICTDGKMLNFYIELHNLILVDIDENLMHEMVAFENFMANK